MARKGQQIEISGDLYMFQHFRNTILSNKAKALIAFASAAICRFYPLSLQSNSIQRRVLGTWLAVWLNLLLRKMRQWAYKRENEREREEERKSVREGDSEKQWLWKWDRTERPIHVSEVIYLMCTAEVWSNKTFVRVVEQQHEQNSWPMLVYCLPSARKTIRDRHR